MGVYGPIMHVSCDACGTEQEYRLTVLAGGAWDARYLDKQLEREGWRDIGGKMLCVDCAEEEDGEPE